jgi:hypothetical protein
MIRDDARAKSELLDKPAPGFAAPVAQHQAEAVGNARDCAAVGVTERVANRLLTDLLRGAAPNVAKLVTQSKVIAVAKTVEACVGPLFFKVEEAPRHLAVSAPALKDAAVDH